MTSLVFHALLFLPSADFSFFDRLDVFQPPPSALRQTSQYLFDNSPPHHRTLLFSKCPPPRVRPEFPSLFLSILPISQLRSRTDLPPSDRFPFLRFFFLKDKPPNHRVFLFFPRGSRSHSLPPACAHLLPCSTSGILWSPPVQAPHCLSDFHNPPLSSSFRSPQRLSENPVLLM